ncbi:MAG: TRAP-type C4-dicarboxylate transport system permease small subunit [bacterium]|jgi:TRAP-type C4-dicarboxylate transport system permease small subunit
MITHVAEGQSKATVNNQFIRLITLLSMIAGIVAAGMIMIAVFLTCQMIFVRFVLNGSTVWQTEVIVYLVVSATLIGLSFVQRERGHVNVDLIPLLLKPRLRYLLAVFTLLMSITVIAIMLWYGFEYWHVAWSRGWTSDTVTAVPLWIPYAAIPLGFGLLLLQMIADLAGIFLRTKTPFDLGEF